MKKNGHIIRRCVRIGTAIEPSHQFFTAENITFTASEHSQRIVFDGGRADAPFLAYLVGPPTNEHHLCVFNIAFGMPRPQHVISQLSGTVLSKHPNADLILHTLTSRLQSRPRISRWGVLGKGYVTLYDLAWPARSTAATG
nr:hypothetical protein [Bacillota bacterium]